MTRDQIIAYAREACQAEHGVVSVAVAGGWHLVDLLIDSGEEPALVAYDQTAFGAAHSFRRYLREIDEGDLPALPYRGVVRAG